MSLKNKMQWLALNYQLPGMSFPCEDGVVKVSDKAGLAIVLPEKGFGEGGRASILETHPPGEGGELCTLNVGHIESYRNQPVLVVNGKGGRLRKVPLHQKALEAIRAYWKAEGHNGTDPGEPIFKTLGKHGPYEARRLTYKAIRHLIATTRKVALIKRRVTPHTLRHTFAVSLLDQGVDLRTVQDLMGHASITTTQAYLHTSDEKKLSAVNSLTFES